MKHRGVAVQGATTAVQGFGKVGRDAARFLTEAGVRVVAVSDVGGAIVSDRGVDVEALGRHVDATGSVAGFPNADHLPAHELLELAVDVLVPAAVEGVINEDNAARVRARIIVEGANGPTTKAADALLADRGILVVPDILANAGGVIVSYFEWVQANQAYWWSEREVEDRLRDRLTIAWDAVADYAARDNLSLRAAATSLAVGRVAEAHRLRGLYP
jgi:glutamate dehydrogenase (NAD(P)+)